MSNEIPLVLHGGSGILGEQIHEAISLGGCKINVNTECQMAFRDALNVCLKADKDLEGKNNPRLLWWMRWKPYKKVA